MDIRSTIGYGFMDLRSYFDKRIMDIEGGQSVIEDAITRTLAQYNDDFNRFVESFVEKTTRPKERYVMPTGGSLQPIEPEHGIPRPTMAYKGYDIGTHIEAAGDAMGDNRLSRALITVGNANSATQEMQMKDRSWCTERILAAMLAKESFQYEDLSRLGYQGAGILDVVPLANGDEALYFKRRGGPTTDDHYMSVEGAISSTNDPFPRIKKNLTEHGTDVDARVIVYVAEDLSSSIQNMINFVPRTRVDESPGTNTATVTNVPERGIGEDVLGKVSGCWIVEAPVLPDGYMLAHLEGRKPLSMREYPSPALQGFFQESFNANGNHMETRYLRMAGFGGRDRTAAAAVQVGVGSGVEYATPEDMQTPLAA